MTGLICLLLNYTIIGKFTELTSIPKLVVDWLLLISKPKKIKEENYFHRTCLILNPVLQCQKVNTHMNTIEYNTGILSNVIDGWSFHLYHRNNKPDAYVTFITKILSKS